MSDWKQDLQDAARERWHSPFGLVLVLGITAAILLSFFAGLDLAEVSGFEWTIVCIASSIVVVGWWLTRIPRAPAGKVGFGLAIHCDDSDLSHEIYSDFVVALRDHLARSHYSQEFSFIEMPERIARQINTEEAAHKLARSANLRFLLYGRARLRKFAGADRHIIDLRSVVRHAPVQKSESQTLGKELGAAVPGRLVIGTEESLLNCELAASHVRLGASFIIGLAAAMSGDLTYAEELLCDTELRLRSDATSGGIRSSVLLNQVQRRLADLYDFMLWSAAHEYTVRRDKHALKRAEGLVSKLRQFKEFSYEANVIAALCAFVLRRDKIFARQEFERCKRVNDGAWRYGLAFLQAYDGDLDGAYRAYQKAFRAPLNDPTTPIQCEEFIQIIVDEEPDKPWLFFCLGLINYRAKSDFQSARQDFSAFLDKIDAGAFPNQVSNVKLWLHEMDSHEFSLNDASS